MNFVTVYKFIRGYGTALGMRSTLMLPALLARGTCVGILGIAAVHGERAGGGGLAIRAQLRVCSYVRSVTASYNNRFE